MEVKAGYKQTDLEVIPEDWEVKSIGKHGTLKARIGWQGLTTAEYLESGSYYLVTGTDFQGGRVNWGSCHFVDKWRYEQDPKIQLKYGDVLITKDGTIGKTGYVEYLPGPATLNSGVFVIRPLHNCFEPLYLHYILTSRVFIEFLSKLSAGSTISHLYQKDFVNFEFFTPKLIKEQSAIAEALSEVDAFIKALELLLSKKGMIKQGAMQELLTRKRQLPEFSGGWEMKQLGDITEIISGGTPSTKIAELWGGTINWCTPTDITRTSGKYLTQTEKRITVEGLKNSSASLLPKGTLLLCSRATIGDVKIAINAICTNQGFKSLICSDQVYNEFLYYLILTIKPKLLEKSIGSTFLEISKKDIASIKINLPSIPEQTAIAEILNDMDAEIIALEEKLTKARQIKQGMMQELLTGRIRLI